MRRLRHTSWGGRRRGSLRRGRESARRRSLGGFTLIELVVVMGMLVLVLVAGYQILTNCLRTESYVERLTVPEKVGEGVMSLVRRDLAGVFYRGMTEALHRQVFLGENQESADGSLDSVRFLTTSEPTKLQGADTYHDMIEDIRTVTIVHYYLEQNPDLPVAGYKLYRKEITDFSTGNAMDSVGLNLEVYDKVRSFNVEYYDGYEWLRDWSSEAQIELQEAALAEAAALGRDLQERIARVSDAETAETTEEQVLPPPAIPVAVRVELEIYASAGGDIIRTPAGEPEVRRFRSIVPLFAAQRVRLPIEEALEGEEAFGDDVEGDGGARGREGRELGTSVSGAGSRDGRAGRGAGGRGPRGGGGRGDSRGGGFGGGRGGAPRGAGTNVGGGRGR